MKNYASFRIENNEIALHAGKISLKYSLDEELWFEEMIRFNIEDVSPDVDHEALQRAVDALHIAGGVSYYKTCCPKKIVLVKQELTKSQAASWTTLYEQGLGEFFFRNKIDFRGLINFSALKGTTPRTTAMKEVRPPLKRKRRVLVPFGGGKDSIVTAELLKKMDCDAVLFRMNAHSRISELSHIAGLPLLSVERRLSPALFKLNADGALNGHVPITAYVTFLSVIAALLFDFDDIVFSNESSASEGNTEYLGCTVNHQWSKGIQAEELIKKYIANHITNHVRVFSLLRPWSELKITERFSSFPQYFSTFTSCNTNWKIERKEGTPLWCGACPKCAFVFACLSAFLPKKTLEGIFGQDLFSNEELVPLFRELLGLAGSKPFECVGSPEETQAAFFLAHKRGEHEKSPAMQMFLTEDLPMMKNPETIVANALTQKKEHSVPPEYLALL